MFRTFLLPRVLQMIPVLLGLSILIFFLSRIMPGDPVRLALGPEATQEQITQYRHELGLDLPLPQQYSQYMKGLLTGHLGHSLRTNRDVSQDLADSFPATLELVLAAMVIAVGVGVPLGVVAGIRKDKWEDQLTRVVALGGIAMPRFWLGILLQLLFASVFHLLPAIGRGDIHPTQITGLYLLDSLLTGDTPAFWSSLKSILLPAITLSLASLAQIMRLTRSNMIEETRRDYILASTAYGVPRLLIVAKYMLKNAFGTTLTTIGLTFGYLLGNAFLVEVVFAWPGMASYGVEAVIGKDFNAVVGVTMVIGVTFLLTNLLVDLIYGWLDPRIKYS